MEEESHRPVPATHKMCGFTKPLHLSEPVFYSLCGESNSFELLIELGEIRDTNYL